MKRKFNDTFAKIPKIKNGKLYNENVGTVLDSESNYLTFKVWEKGSKKRIYVNDYKCRTVGYIDCNNNNAIVCDYREGNENHDTIKWFLENYEINWERGRKMNIKEAVRTIMDSDYDVIGIRHITSDESYKVGDYARNSYDWDIENDVSSYETDPKELDGTSAYFTDIDTLDDEEEVEKKLLIALEESKVYSGAAILLGGDRYDWGNDDNEIIIEDAEVLYIF